ncbi:hypothetical protein RRG08_038516 [Elysia crispata]|uniref:Uncharacterized protein n=1 Tax=Elysia crispata TaxID=231223 RepID=A0AAE1DYN0_9GAST|nr:hypothetical protein RRG08_038516 [Elysia crispata]
MLRISLRQNLFSMTIVINVSLSLGVKDRPVGSPSRKDKHYRLNLLQDSAGNLQLNLTNHVRSIFTGTAGTSVLRHDDSGSQHWASLGGKF